MVAIEWAGVIIGLIVAGLALRYILRLPEYSDDTND